MTLTPRMFLIVCPLLFLAGFVDAIGGGGGLISLPAYLLAGVPIHQTIATNKLSSTCGTAMATLRFIKEGLVNWKLAVPTIVTAMLGSTLGANASMATEDSIMEKILFFVLPVVAFIVLNPKIFHDNEDAELTLNPKVWITALVSSFFPSLIRSALLSLGRSAVQQRHLRIDPLLHLRHEGARRHRLHHRAEL